jgi:hypothetical protein
MSEQTVTGVGFFYQHRNIPSEEKNLLQIVNLSIESEHKVGGFVVILMLKLKQGA